MNVKDFMAMTMASLDKQQQEALDTLNSLLKVPSSNNVFEEYERDLKDPDVLKRGPDETDAQLRERFVKKIRGEE